MIYNEINQWVRLYAESMPPVCIRVLKTVSKVLTLEEATVIAKKQTRKADRSQERHPEAPTLGPTASKEAESHTRRQYTLKHVAFYHF